MDKQQKELMKTYFRKRNIAAVGYNSSFKSYEISQYAVENNLIDLKIETLNGNNLKNVIIEKPELIPLLATKIDFKEVDNGYFMQVLEEKPELFDILGKELNNYHYFTPHHVLDMMVDQPQLIERFKDRFDDFTGGMVVELLTAHSKNNSVINTIKKYDYDFKFLYGHEIKNLLVNAPSIYPHFIGLVHKIKPSHLVELFLRIPGLIGPLKDELKRLSDEEINDIVSKNPNYNKFIKDNR